MLKIFHFGYDESIGDYKNVPVGELNGDVADIKAITKIAEEHAVKINPNSKVDVSYVSTEMSNTLWVCLVMDDVQHICVGVDEAYTWQVKRDRRDVC